MMLILALRLFQLKSQSKLRNAPSSPVFPVHPTRVRRNYGLEYSTAVLRLTAY